MINAVSAADIAFIMSSVLLRNKMAERLAFVSEDGLCKKIYNKTIIFSYLCYLPQPSASADITDLGFDN